MPRPHHNSMRNGKTKILYIITKSVWGGAQRYVFDLATNLPKDKFEAIVATGGDGTLIEKLETQGVRVIKIPGITKDINILQEIKSLFYLGKIFAREKPDVIHLNSSKFGGLGALASRLSSLVFRHSSIIIFTAHGWPFNEDRNFMARGIIYFFSWLTAIFANRVINITKTDYQQSLKFPLLTSGKFIHIPNGLEFNDQHFLPPTKARKLLRLRQEQFVIGTIAELTKNKGLPYLIDAINQIKFKVKSLKHAPYRTEGSGAGFKVIIIGEGEERSKLENQVKSLGLEKTIFLPGFLVNAAQYLKGFTIFLFPSVKEGLPYALMEAMAAGLPIIASQTGGIPDLIENGKSGILINAKDSAALAKEMERLMLNREFCQTLGKEAEIKLRTNFQFRDMMQKTVNLYEQKQ